MWAPCNLLKLRQLTLDSMATKLLIKEGILFLFYMCISVELFSLLSNCGVSFDSHILFVVEWKGLDRFWLDIEQESQLRSC